MALQNKVVIQSNHLHGCVIGSGANTHTTNSWPATKPVSISSGSATKVSPNQTISHPPDVIAQEFVDDLEAALDWQEFSFFAKIAPHCPFYGWGLTRATGTCYNLYQQHDMVLLQACEQIALCYMYL